mmetsp:Transcript_25282/g.88210  ORF Transcript_25282/g.88210 Transcript_25282/m.88210 type:complete len:419 (-) Transcript_25282:154-1410(-)
MIVQHGDERADNAHGGLAEAQRALRDHLLNLVRVAREARTQLAALDRVEEERVLAQDGVEQALAQADADFLRRHLEEDVAHHEGEEARGPHHGHRPRQRRRLVAEQPLQTTCANRVSARGGSGGLDDRRGLRDDDVEQRVLDARRGDELEEHEGQHPGRRDRQQRLVRPSKLPQELRQGVDAARSVSQQRAARRPGGAGLPLLLQQRLASRLQLTVARGGAIDSRHQPPGQARSPHRQAACSHDRDHSQRPHVRHCVPSVSQAFDPGVNARAACCERVVVDQRMDCHREVWGSNEERRAIGTRRRHFSALHRRSWIPADERHLVLRVTRARRAPARPTRRTSVAHEGRRRRGSDLLPAIAAPRRRPPAAAEEARRASRRDSARCRHHFHNARGEGPPSPARGGRGSARRRIACGPRTS